MECGRCESRFARECQLADVMQYPAVVIPFTTADPELDPIDGAFIPMHELDKQVQELCK